MDPGKRTFYLGRYNCIEQLGTGPLGETYRAKIYGVAGFEKQFAVKRLHPQLSEDEAFVARFVQAASAFATLEHQGIARVHEVNAQGAHYYIVVDLIRGLDLRRLLDLLQQRGEALAADAAMTIAVDIAHALEHAHCRTNVLAGGVLHLGLTAPSVMLTYEGDVKLVDVGLVAALVRPGWSDDDALVPTLAYLAPEVWRGEGFDVRADVFSLGVVLHELLGGGRAFLSDRAAELRKAIEGGPPPPPSADPRLQQIVTRALEPDPGRRFATVEEMRVAIQAILGGRAERARADLSATVRRLAAPRERRTGAFASVTLAPAGSAMTSPVTSTTTPPPMPPSRPHAWAPPVPRPPVGGSLSQIPVHNTLAGIGPDDQALVPIELVELPGLPTEKAMPTVADEAETNRVQRAGSDRVRAAIPPPPPPAALEASVATSSDSSGGGKPANAIADGNGATKAATNDLGTPVGAAAAAEAAASVETAATAPAMNGTNGESAPESSWTPPALTPAPPSPEPLFAEPADERPDPVEPARSSVPGATMPPARRGGTIAVIAGVALLATAGALAIYAGLRGPASTTTAATVPTEPTAPAAEERRAAEARPVAPPPRQASTTTTAAATPTATRTPAATTPTATVPRTAAATTRTAPATSPQPSASAPTATAAKSTTASPTATAVTATPEPASNPTKLAPQTTATPPSGPTFVIASTPDGATVFVDGEERGTTPAQIAAAPGRHALVVLAEGQKMVKRSVELVGGGRLDLQLEPARLTAAIAGSDGLKVRCHTHGELRIFVDGEDSGRTCPNDERISVTAGPHKIGLYSARTGEMHELEHEVDVAEGNNSTRVYVRY